MSIAANPSQYKGNAASKQYTDMKMAEHDNSPQAHKDLRAAIAQATQASDSEKKSNKSQPNGYAALDASGKLYLHNVPVIGNNQIGDGSISENKLGVYLNQKINQKVDAVQGKGLSDNNYDNAAVAMVAGIGDIAREVQNLETNKVNHAALNSHAGNQTLHISTAERQSWNRKLDSELINTASGVAGIGQDGFIPDQLIKNTIARKTDLVQPDWNQVNGSAKDFIKNKPSLNFLPLGGGTMAGDINMNNKNISLLNNIKVHGELKVDFIRPSTTSEVHIFSDLNMAGRRIILETIPTEEEDAVNKKYVDNAVAATADGKVVSHHFNEIQVVEQYPEVEEEGVLYLKKVAT